MVRREGRTQTGSPDKTRVQPVLDIMNRLRRVTGVEGLDYDHLRTIGYRLHTGKGARYLSPRLKSADFVVWVDAFIAGWTERDRQLEFMKED